MGHGGEGGEHLDRIHPDSPMRRAAAIDISRNSGNNQPGTRDRVDHRAIVARKTRGHDIYPKKALNPLPEPPLPPPR
jgi:hypothetical protein